MKLQHLQRERLRVNGTVQGVGFRPFVFRLAKEIGVDGFVVNRPDGVTIEIEGDSDQIELFVARLESNSPVAARIRMIERTAVEPVSETGFAILESEINRDADTALPPDLALCEGCLKEMRDPADRRFGYPFINCTNCGPRYTIISAIPYDRPNTSMAPFEMCSTCAAEYRNPVDRRFHAQPVACSECGPDVWLPGGSRGSEATQKAIAALHTGSVVAIRGLGGFHLAVDATNDQAVKNLRTKKGRQEKPLAMMASSVDQIRNYCHVSEDEAKSLEGHDAPIVLLKRLNQPTNIAPSVAGDNRYFGFMLPYTPLHHLLMDGNFDALVMTSGNLSEEPIAIDNDEAISRLKGIADIFLLHNRDILQRCDDSIVRHVSGERRVIRRARGFVPQPIQTAEMFAQPVLAVGGELKNTVAFARGHEVILSQHIGDLDNPTAMALFEHCVNHLESVLQLKPAAIACDMHPEYLSTKWANAQAQLPVVYVQHHHAHMAAVMAEHHVDTPAVGIVLDGAGFGSDGTIWGGEVLVGDASDFKRYAWLQPVALPGGSAAMREPWRMALSYLAYAYGNKRFRILPDTLLAIPEHSREMVFRMIDGQLNSPMTSSCGRLFDGVAALLGIGSYNTYEAQAAIALEMAAIDVAKPRDFSSTQKEITGFRKGPIPFDWIIKEVVDGISAGDSIGEISASFHRAVGEIFVSAALSASREFELETTCLSGGVFQNAVLLDYVTTRLAEEGQRVFAHESVPTNDGGLALGQAVVANARLRSDRKED